MTIPLSRGFCEKQASGMQRVLVQAFEDAWRFLDLVLLNDFLYIVVFPCFPASEFLRIVWLGSFYFWVLSTLPL